VIKKNLLVANWKMNLGLGQSRELTLGLVELAGGLKNTEIWVAPSATSIAAVCTAAKGSAIKCGAQNVHPAKSGAFTGEISIPMLEELGATFGIVGHSERRHQFGESNQLVANRAIGTLKSGFFTILCIGEKLDERESGATNSVLKEQLDPVLSDLSKEMHERLVIAYEPVWAIGTGKVATPTEVSDTHAFISSYYREKSKFECCPILYGGSVTPDNYASIISIDAVSGALVGGASLTLASMKALAEISDR
jgi:triosephosphate isomerase